MDRPTVSPTGLIPNNSDAEGKRTVNARDLHEFLKSKQEFANWIKSRIRDYGFEKNHDFVVFDNFIKNPQGGRPSKEYHVTLDMAKELSMVERNEKGKQARRYFIACERRLRQETRPDAKKLAGSELAKKLTFSTIEREFHSAVKLLRTAGAHPPAPRFSTTT